MMGFLRRLWARPGASRPAATAAPRDVYLGLRGRVLDTEPGDVGITPNPDLPRAWGVLLEIAQEGGTATIVALADGTTSLYTSTGGGIIGGGQHETVASAAKRAVHVAEAHLEAFPPTSDLQVPRPGRSALVILTYDGPRRLEDETTTFGRGDRSVGTVYAAMQDVMTELRLSEAGRRPGRSLA